MGFAKKNGMTTKDLEVREQDGGKYVYAVVKQKGRSTPEVLADALPKLVESIKFEKSMKWNESGVSFSRPIRWFVALLGDMVIPFEYAGVVSSNITRGLRPYDSPEIKIKSADKYFDIIRESRIVLDTEERKVSILEQIEQAASLVGGEAIIDDDLLNEVANLVEMPTAVMGEFNSEFLQLPREVLISVMKKHQRYFPVTPLHLPPNSLNLGERKRGARDCCRTLLPFAMATILALILSGRETNMCSGRVSRMQISLSARI